MMLWQRLAAPSCTARLPLRRFCALAVPPGLRDSPHVRVVLRGAMNQMKPGTGGKSSRHGETTVGVGDRGVGLVYKDGRPASSDALAAREAQTPPQGTFVIKIQPPLDVSGDSQGGAGMITPATLLVSDKTWGFVRFVKEEDEGHFPLLKCALSEDIQVAYRYAEIKEDLSMKVFTAVRPESSQVGW